MDIATLWQYAPKAFVTLIGIGLVLEMRKYKRKNDPAAWLRDIYARTAKAAQNEEYRLAELADADTQIAQCPTPNPITPITNRQQVCIAGFPKMLFMTGLSGCVFLYLGLFETMPSGVAWPVYTGWAFLALTAVFYWFSERIRPYYRRAQQLNRKYLLQKAGKDPARLETLKEVLEYYPSLTQLWLELADQNAVEKRFDEAVDAVRKARAIAPGEMDLALVEASFQLRRGDTDAVTKLLNEAENMKKAATDPRLVIYRAAAALQRNEKKTALRQGKEALELDGDFTETLLKRDEGLAELAALWEPLLKERENTILAAAAARQEARKAGEEEKK